MNATLTKENIVTQITLRGQQSPFVTIGCVVKSNITHMKGIIYRLHDPVEHPTLAISICWFDGSSYSMSLEEFEKDCAVTHTLP